VLIAQILLSPSIPWGTIYNSDAAEEPIGPLLLPFRLFGKSEFEREVDIVLVLVRQQPTREKIDG
jgi:hypothetical protein